MIFANVFVYSVLLYTFVHPLNAYECACATGNVHIRTGAGVNHGTLGYLLKSHCLPFKGHMNTVSSGMHWANVDFNERDGWISATYLTFKTCTAPTTSPVRTTDIGCPHIISRQEWGARLPSANISQLPSVPQNVYIHHGATPGCLTKKECIEKIKLYQNYHMDAHGWPDIGYSFVVGEDGNIYEARGWDEIGAHTYGHNYDGLGICIIGDFTTHVPNDAALDAVKNLIICGVRLGKIGTDYVLKGHRDVGQTACPGEKLYDLIQQWPHYYHKKELFTIGVF